MVERLEPLEEIPLPKETRKERKERVSREMRQEERLLIAETNERVNQAVAMARQAGRPSTYDQSKAMEICSRIALGQSLSYICKQEGFPCEATVIAWLNNPANLCGGSPFVKSYLRARELQADSLFDQVLDIADDTSKDIITLPGDSPNENGKTVLNPVAVARARVRIDTRLRMAGKLNPKKYGEKLQAELSGTVEVETTVIPGDRLDRQARDRLREILATAKDITPDQ